MISPSLLVPIPKLIIKNLIRFKGFFSIEFIKLTFYHLNLTHTLEKIKPSEKIFKDKIVH